MLVAAFVAVCLAQTPLPPSNFDQCFEVAGAPCTHIEWSYDQYDFINDVLYIRSAVDRWVNTAGQPFYRVAEGYGFKLFGRRFHNLHLNPVDAPYAGGGQQLHNYFFWWDSTTGVYNNTFRMVGRSDAAWSDQAPGNVVPEIDSVLTGFFEFDLTCRTGC